MLRFSDDEVPLAEAQISKKTDGSNVVKPLAIKQECEGGDVGPNKPNFVYIVRFCSQSKEKHFFNSVVAI